MGHDVGPPFELGAIDRPRTSGGTLCTRIVDGARSATKTTPKWPPKAGALVNPKTTLSGNRPMNSSRSRTLGPSNVASDRRSRARLRDLCDEVLASFHVAQGQDPISEQDRETAKELLRGVAPLQRLATN